MKRLHIISLGCPKNFVDSEVMLGILEEDGWEFVDQPKEGDVLLINTCGFIQSAVEEAIDEILELVKIKEEYPDKILVVTGCLVQRYQEELQREFAEVDLFVGTEGVPDISRLIAEVRQTKTSRMVFLPAPFLMNARLPRRVSTPFFRAWTKITEGCNNHCSYCLIPSIRGSLRSRSIPDLVEESVRLEQSGVRELTLIAQDLTAYGSEDGNAPVLNDLLGAIIKRTSIPWIRLMYLYPTGVSEELLAVMAENPRVVPYLDIPFQHVSDSVLKTMNRRYTGEDLSHLIEKVRSFLPEVAIRTTFLLGFPGETEKDVEAVERFLKEVKIDHVGVFAYANEAGAPSENFPNQCSEREKTARVSHILSVQAAVSERILQRFIGRREPVLVEGLSRETELLLEGRTRFQAPDIDGCVYINDGEANPGDIVTVSISDAQVYDLVGGIVGKD